MTSIQYDINKVEPILSENFEELLPENSLYNFIFGSSKKIRSKYTILYLRATNSLLNNNVYKIIASGEIIHNASLLHDDVIDNSLKRRNLTTIGQLYSDKISILSGDYLLSIVMDILLSIDDKDVLSIFNNCIKEMCKAEVLQFNLRYNKPTLNEYINICRGKTAVLFKSILRACLKVNNSDYFHADELSELYGINFQIKNDLSETGYQEDISNGIYTAREILGIEKTIALLDNNKKRMSEILQNLPDNQYKSELESLILDNDR